MAGGAGELRSVKDPCAAGRVADGGAGGAEGLTIFGEKLFSESASRLS